MTNSDVRKSQDHKKWLKIRQELFKQIVSEVDLRLGKESSDLSRYRNKYDSEFKRKWQAAPKEELFDAIDLAQVVLVGDFHALQQSQKSFLRLLKAKHSGQFKTSVALECFESKDQVHVDLFLSGKISEKKFLQNVNWYQRWGFPWEHYRGIVLWCQENNIPILAINKILAKNDLFKRDKHAAAVINKYLSKNPTTKLFVLIGDLHLASQHLPSLIAKHNSCRLLRVFQNSEKIYFSLLKKHTDTGVDVVRLGKRDYCLLSVPPWVKWQNYLMYLEQAYDLELDDEDDDVLVDYTEHVTRYVRILSDDLKLKINSNKLSVYSAADDIFWEKVSTFYSKSLCKTIEQWIEERRSFYLPEICSAYMARASVNHSSQIAMLFVHAEVSKQSKVFEASHDNFLQLVWLEAVSYFGSKIVNPKRKSDTLVDIRATLESQGRLDMGKEALMLALSQKMSELMAIAGNKTRRKNFKPRKKWSYFQAATLLGGILGEKMYFGYQQGIFSVDVIRKLLKIPLQSSDFKDTYFELIRLIEAVPAPFKSKKEKL